MKLSRIVPVALLCACLAGLAACGDSDTTSAPKGPAPAAASPAPLSSAAAQEAADDAADYSAANGGVKETGDKGLCDTVNKAGSTMKNDIMGAQKADGHVEAADAKKAFVSFHGTVDAALAFAKPSDVTVAARAVADEVNKAATAKDPITAAADAGFDELSGKLTTACKTVGVTINF
ncbi:hypothetical protein [Actinoplanes sp. NPDC020271]|uniref:hypothetical protein n=1 Tax=Actinoplanes sp. NPDC020271 TaxID=3363896 RepID=UPI003799BCDD